MQIDPSVGRLGATLRDVTKPITEEPLPPDFVTLLMLLDQAEAEEAMHADTRAEKTLTAEVGVWL